MVDIRIEGKTNGTTASASITTVLNSDMEKQERYDFEFSTFSLDPNQSTFWYESEPLLNIIHSPSTSPLFKTEELNLYDKNDKEKKTRLVETGMSGVTILPDSKFSKKLGLIKGIRGFDIDKNSYKESCITNGKRFTSTIPADDNNPFLEYVEFKLLPNITSEMIPSKYEGVNHQLISVDSSIIVEVENNEIIGIDFPKLGKNIKVSHSGDDAFGSTVVKLNGKIVSIHQSKQIGYVTTDGNGSVVYKTLADGNDEYEYMVSKWANKLTDSIIKYDDEMKNALERSINIMGYDVNVYLIKCDPIGTNRTNEYFYFTDHSSVWALYKSEMKFDKKLNSSVAQPLKKVYEESNDDQYKYKCTYYYGNYTYSKSIEETCDSSRYIIDTRNIKVDCKVDKPDSNGERKYVIDITRQTGGSAYLMDTIRRFDAIHKHGSNNYINAIETLIKYNHYGYIEPAMMMHRYLKTIEDICKNPDIMKWSNIFNNTLDITDINLFINPGDTISWAKIILQDRGEYFDTAQDELSLLDRIVWSSFMLPSDMKYDKYAGAYHSDITLDNDVSDQKDDDDLEVDVDKDKFPTASNACEAMCMEN